MHRAHVLAGVITGAAALALVACGAPKQASLGGTSSPTPTSSSATPTPTATSPHTYCSQATSTTSTGGALPCLSFAIVGDTRPATIDDTASYPTAIVTKIYQDVQNEPNGRPSFVVATGDYQYSRTSGSQAAAQLDKYLTAQGQFDGLTYYAMGNHECTGYTDSNCATSSSVSGNNNYAAFASKMLSPLGLTKPYYALHFAAADNSWTAKFVFIAANAWDTTQANWLSNEMSQPTTYTFVVRHEGINANTAPGVTPSQNIIGQYPFTMLLEGHTHTFAYYSSDREVITGNGGAPLTGSANYGYTVVRQRDDGALDFTNFDYSSHAVIRHFVVTKDGSPTN